MEWQHQPPPVLREVLGVHGDLGSIKSQPVSILDTAEIGAVVRTWAVFAPLEPWKVFAEEGGMDGPAEEEEQTVCEPRLHSTRLEVSNESLSRMDSPNFVERT